jgi:glycine C-acetyltransferase
MVTRVREIIGEELQRLRESGLYKEERILDSPQDAHITVRPGEEVINFCANNYLGLADHPRIVEAARESLDRWGYGMSSVRFICGTQAIHKTLEARITEFLGTEDTILYSSCFDANGGLFETLLGPEDAVISDSLNHASIIDGIRLSKAKRLVYRNADMKDLEEKLREAANARFRLIATDGVFSMDGTVAPLAEICDLAEAHEAMVMVDDSHAVGFYGPTGRGTPEACGVIGRIDVLTGTLGKALGGASGGYTSARREIVELLRQRSRPYLFSNTLAPTIVSASLRAFTLLEENQQLLEALAENTAYFRRKLADVGFDIPAGDHPIVPIMLGDAKRAVRYAERLLALGVYVIAFSYPVVPKGTARIRTQVSAAHSKADLDYTVEKFAQVRDEIEGST